MTRKCNSGLTRSLIVSSGRDRPQGGDLRDKQVEKSGVVGIWRHGGVATIHEDVIPGGGEQSASELVLLRFPQHPRTASGILNVPRLKVLMEAYLLISKVSCLDLDVDVGPQL